MKPKDPKSSAKRAARPPADPQGLHAAARVIAAGGRVPKKFANARPASAGPTLQVAAALDKVTPARRAAFEILQAMSTGRGHSDELLHGHLTTNLSEADRALATTLVMGTLRWQIALDARIRTHLERPGQKIAEPVLIALRLGALQLLHLDRIPAHAALSESVELCRVAGEPHAAGMVNAILRKIAASPAPPPPPIFETPARLAERLGHPAWLVERWIKNYGRPAAAAICEADQREPAAENPDSTEMPPSPNTLPHVDPGSRLVAELAASALPAAASPARIWDCCAAPGGKTLILAARHPTAHILATDSSPRRLARLETRLRRFPYAANVRTLLADSTALPPEEGPFDLILLDAPCSGTGTLGRNPEIRLRLLPAELVRQAERQRALLAAALPRLAPGGRIVYSTCSLEPEENEAIIHAVAPTQPTLPVDQLPLPGSTTLDPTMIREGALRTLPGTHASDGFYAIVLTS